MKTKYYLFRFLIIYSILALLIVSCSTKISYDDAVRIKPKATKKYNIHPETSKIRNGNALRGEVIKIEVYATPCSCPITDTTKYNFESFLLFVDSSVKKEKYIEKIPLEDVDLMGPKLAIRSNNYNNINLFENYNNPLLHKEIREVPVDTIWLDTCNIKCPCEPLPDIFLQCPFCDIKLQCPDRELQSWFLSLKPGYAIYSDYNSSGEIIGREDWNFDIAAGVRLGQSKRWGLGVIYSTGVRTYYSIDSSLIRRPSVNLYARYDLIRDVKKYKTRRANQNKEWISYDTIYTKTYDCCYDSMIIIKKINYEIFDDSYEKEFSIEKRPCLNPFIYGLLGLSIDKFSIDLIQMNFNDDCKRRVELYLPYADISLPLNYGIGIGVEIPLASYMDLSLDLGFRSIAYGNKLLGGGLLIPTLSRVNSIILRLGIVF